MAEHDQFITNIDFGGLPLNSSEEMPGSFDQALLSDAPAQVQAASAQVQAASEKTAEDYQADPLFQQSLVLSKKLMGEGTPFNPALASLLYFTKMGELASKKGSSVFGSIAGAGVAPAAYLMQKEKEKAARDAGLGKTAVSIMGALKPKKAGKPTFYLNSKGEKVPFTDVEFAALPRKEQLTYTPFKAKGAGTDKERYAQQIIDIRPKIKDKTATQEEITLYSIAYQMLGKGYTTTRIVDGQEQTIRVPGVSLTGLPVPEGIDGGDKILSSKGVKFDKNQIDSSRFGSRMFQNEGVIRTVLDNGYRPNVADLKKISLLKTLGFGAIGLSPEAQEFHAAASNWVAAQLRDESGAAIAPSEYVDALTQYFPLAGEAQRVTENKRGLRETAISSMIAAAGDAFAATNKLAVPFLTYKSGDTELPILNPKGFYELTRANTLKGKGLEFQDGLLAMTYDDLKSMLTSPDADKRYSAKQLAMIEKELDKKDPN